MSPPVKDTGYALDFVSVLQHVASKLDGAPGALSIDSIAQSLSTLAFDLHRVKVHEGATTDAEAKLWLVQRAVSELGDQCIEEPPGFVMLTTAAKYLMWQGKPLALATPNPFVNLGDPFNPMSGWAAQNIRVKGDKPTGGGSDDLKDSLRAFGWLKYLKALMDENGVLLTGHRRMTIANELREEPGVEADLAARNMDDLSPKVEVVKLGRGDAADQERLKIAIASNTGGHPLSGPSRKHIAERLTMQGWTLEDIGRTLGVSKSTIGTDLADVEFSSDWKKARTEQRGRPKKNAGKSAQAAAAEKAEKAEKEAKKAAELADRVRVAADMRAAGATWPEVGEAIGLGKTQAYNLKHPVEAELARRAAEELHAGTTTLDFSDYPDVVTEEVYTDGHAQEEQTGMPHVHQWRCVECGEEGKNLALES